jgi:two-component system, OmpR family, sensor histidine kinase KdpD
MEKNNNIFFTIIQYFLAILIVLGITLLLSVLHNNLTIQVIALLYLLPVVFISRLWGLFPGILAAILSFLSFNYYFIPPYYSLAVHKTQDLLSLIVFLIIAFVISQLLGHDRQNLEAIMHREHEATNLYELSTALAGLQDDQAIAQLLAEKITATFRVENVEVTIFHEPDQIHSVSAITGSSPSSTLKPNFQIPLATPRGQQGTVKIWQKDSPLSLSEQQLLSTFTSQGALAVERIKLVQMDNRAKVLEESDKLKSALLSSVSHELRSPLATIKASISSVRSKTVLLDQESEQELLAAIEEETDHLNQLVGNLLDMSRIETGAMVPQRKWNALNEIVNGVIKRMSQIVQNHNIVINIPDDLPLLPVDYVQMEQVFTNLISNSAKYAPQGTVIEIIARLQDDQMVLVKIRNQSPHLEEEHLERIFDKFYRVTAADKVTGTGLGLSICKGIIEAHGGRIWATNEKHGFSFSFTLPIIWDGARPQTPKEI